MWEIHCKLRWNARELHQNRMSTSHRLSAIAADVFKGECKVLADWEADKRRVRADGLWWTCVGWQPCHVCPAPNFPGFPSAPILSKSLTPMCQQHCPLRFGYFYLLDNFWTVEKGYLVPWPSSRHYRTIHKAFTREFCSLFQLQRRRGTTQAPDRKARLVLRCRVSKFAFDSPEFWNSTVWTTSTGRRRRERQDGRRNCCGRRESQSGTRTTQTISAHLWNTCR